MRYIPTRYVPAWSGPKKGDGGGDSISGYGTGKIGDDTGIISSEDLI